MDPNKKIVFEMSNWLRLDGESGPYIQYVHARIATMLKKLEYNPDTTVDWSVLKHENELNLMMKLSEFNLAVSLASNGYKPSSLCGLLYEAAKLFNKFYAECPVAKAETEELKLARLGLAKAVATSLERGLNLLGIDAPQRM